MARMERITSVTLLDYNLDVLLLAAQTNSATRGKIKCVQTQYVRAVSIPDSGPRIKKLTNVGGPASEISAPSHFHTLQYISGKTRERKRFNIKKISPISHFLSYC